MSSKRRGKGRVIIFLGPDGSGKSSLLEKVEASLSARGKDFRICYFAPGFLKRYRPKGPPVVTTNPHEGRQYGAFLVAAKIALMLFEFNMGVRRARRQNDIILFDRFIHDLLVDPIRYRLGHMRWWMRLLLALAPCPDLAVIINAPAEVIRARKQEVPLKETIRQVKAYNAIARRFHSALLVKNTGTPDEGAATVLSRILSL